MTNLIIGWLGGTPPSPWQKLTDYDGEYLRCTATAVQAKTTGGNSTHTHAIINFSVGNCGSQNHDCDVEGICENCGTVHNNHSLGSNSVSSVANDPPYFTFELIYMDLATWEASERRFPEGAILLSDIIQSWGSLSRHSDSDGKLWKIGTAGTSGGTSTRAHTISIALGSGGNGINAGVYYDPEWPTEVRTAADAIHSHPSADSTSGNHSTLPKRVQLRFYRVTELTDRALAGVICFADGTPSAYWNIVDYADCFLQGADSNAAITGSSTHGENGLSKTSGSFGGLHECWSRGFQVAGQAHPHNHPMYFDLQSANHEPPYVNLVPVKLNTTLYHAVPRSRAQVVGLW